MYYQEKKTIALLFSGTLVCAAYCIYAYQQLQTGAPNLGNDLRFWASAMLICIGAGIVTTIIIQILFHIINAMMNHVTACEEEDPTIEDERDKLINLKSMRNSYVVVGVGFVIALITLVMQLPPAVMLNIAFLSFMTGSLFEGISQLYFYRRGV